MQPNSNKPDINETGLKGFLKWFQREQGELYQKLAPQIAKAIPSAFSDYNQSVMTDRRLGRLGDSTDPLTLNVASDGSFLQQIGVNAALETPTVSIDTADAANSGNLATPSGGWLSNLIQGASQLYLTKSQLDTAKQVTNLQLQRAQAGLPPLNIDMSKLGVPSVGVGLTSGTTNALMWIAGILGGAYLLGAFAKRAR